MALLVHEENKMNTRIQEQLLDMTNLAAGTIFDNMLKINKDLTRKLKVKIDLRTQSALGPGAELDLQNYDAGEALEIKLQHYIDQFIDLNELHAEELDVCQKKLTESVENKVADFEKMIKRCVDSLKDTVSN